jgi:high-affinity iron transporter
MAGAALIAFGGPASPTARSGSAGSDAQHLVAILQYLQFDYPAAVASGEARELAEQRSLSAEAAATADRVPGGARFAVRVATVDARVQQGQDPAGVTADCASLVDDIVAATGIVRAPPGPPDLAEAAHLFSRNCASCHGATGHGDGVAAPALTPRPADFHSEEVMSTLTPFKAFNVIRFGVKGTSMAAFAGLDEKQRWALAFYLFTLREPACDHTPPRTSLDLLANRSDGELAAQVPRGGGEVACLRRNLPALDAPALLAAARAQAVSAQRTLAGGNPRGAESALLDAYLVDIEPIEPWLLARDHDITAEIEASFTTTRAALQQEKPEARDDVSKLLSLLDRAAGLRPATRAVSVFWFSVLVIVREGFEAAVIIAALLAVVKKRKQVARARFVHAGWVSALCVGAVVFVTGRVFLAGAMNERLEGCLAIVATAMLLHAALWLNAQPTTRRSMGELRDRTRGALDRGALALFGIAFLAMFRESFETAVFLEALSIDSPRAVLWGALSGVASLSGLVFAVGRLGLRLPMTTLFKVSTAVLVVTAVMLVGQGVHSFEEIGIVPSGPVPFAQIEFLGIYPDRFTLLAQLAVAVLALLGRALIRSTPKSPRLEGVAEPGE